MHIKQLIGKALGVLGYEIRKVSVERMDLNLYYATYGKETVEKRSFYNLGAGAFRHPAWTNVDHASEWYSKIIDPDRIEWDLLEMSAIPVESSSAQIVYSSHTIEHITDEAAMNMFSESHRILSNGGVLRLTTPDIDLCYWAYKRNDYHFFYWIRKDISQREYLSFVLSSFANKASIHQLFLARFATNTSTQTAIVAPERIDDGELELIFREMPYEQALNYCTSRCTVEIQRKYPYYHMNWWNTDKLLRMLRAAGFEIIYKSAYGQSCSPVLRNTAKFDRNTPQQSLYVEAVK